MYRQALFLALIALACGAAEPAHPCASCHPDQVASYAQTGMGKSLSLTATQPRGRLSHRQSGTDFSISYSGGSMRQAMSRDGLTAQYEVAYVIGSGHRAFGYLIQIGDALFQSPLGYYPHRQTWGMAPGYDANPTPDFSRPITLECLSCHSGKPRPIPGTRSRYEQPPVAQKAISCERCHGSGERHVLEPSRSNIVNPARLSLDARDSVCEQCHLSGSARVLNPGKSWMDFSPGSPLEETFTVYVDDSEGAGLLTVISQSQQMKRSACWKASGGRLWCGSCHDPHQEPAEKVAHYRQRCLVCHDSGLSEDHKPRSLDCVSCHMASRATIDGAHTPFTDHHVRLRPAAPSSPRAGASLTAWRAGPSEYEKRNLGLAYVYAGEARRSAELLNRAFPLLSDAQHQFPKDPDITAGLALLLQLKGVYREAAQAFDLAVQLRPDDVRFYRNAATAWLAAGDVSRAARDLEAVIERDQSDEAAYRMLVDIYHRSANRRDELNALDRYLKLDPQSIHFRARKLALLEMP